MFCPKCKIEYRTGFKRCTNCQVPLVEGLSEQVPVNFQYVKLLSTENPAEITLLQSILDAEDIPFHMKGGHMVGAGALQGGAPAIFYVADYMYDKALQIVNDLHWGD